MGGNNPKRHELMCNHAKFAKGLEGRAGYLSRADQMKLTEKNGPLAVKKSGKYNGVRDRLKASQCLGPFSSLASF